MMAVVFNLSSLLLVTGLLYACLALSAWGLLLRRHAAIPVALWSLGALSIAASLLLLALPSVASQALRFVLAQSLFYAALVMRVSALRWDLRRPLPVSHGLLLWLMATLGYLLCSQWPDPTLRSVYSCTVLAIGTATLGSQAAATARLAQSRSAGVLAWTERLLAAALALRAVTLALGQAAPLSQGQHWDGLLLMAIAAVTLTYSNLAYLGMVFDRTRADEHRAREAQWAESTRREAAEQQTQELQDLLHQRDRLAAERQQLLQLLAHEIRQPLHNASGALQAATGVLQAPQDERSQAMIAERLQRAQVVLGDVQSVLDNTLAAATLLSRQEPLARQDVDVDFLIDLALGDLGEAQRARVRTDWQASLRSVAVEPGLVRLALRNLLRNAFNHGGRDVRVTLRIQEQPGALVLSVIDSGSGMTPAGLQAVNEAQARGISPLATSGLGLYIVRRVMALHGGRLVLGHNMPQGLIVQLVFPQSRVGPPGQVSAATAA